MSLFSSLLPTKGVVYILDREVVPYSSKICDWSLNSSWDHFGLHQGKNMVRVTMEPAFIIHNHGVMGFVIGEAKEVLLLQMSRDHGRDLMFWYFF